MCFIVVSPTPIRKLCGAAKNLQDLLTDGTLSAAFDKQNEHGTGLAVAAFDALAESAAAVEAQLKGVSPFLRYRREILAEGPMAANLRRLALNLYNDRQGVRLSTFFQNADEHYTRIALEMIAGYTRQGETDPHFMTLATDINEALLTATEGSAS